MENEIRILNNIIEFSDNVQKANIVLENFNDYDELIDMFRHKFCSSAFECIHEMLDTVKAIRRGRNE